MITIGCPDVGAYFAFQHVGRNAVIEPRSTSVTRRAERYVQFKKYL